eukprot:SAG31_NODE_2693_length_5236_cov_23.769905_4_plen_161_part_00
MKKEALFQRVPPSQVKSYVLQQYPRCSETVLDPHQLWQRNLCIDTPASEFGWMGYSMRNVTRRYTAWFPWTGTEPAPVIPTGLGQVPKTKLMASVVITTLRYVFHAKIAELVYVEQTINFFGTASRRWSILILWKWLNLAHGILALSRTCIMHYCHYCDS